MKLEQIKREGGRWGFTGTRKTWPDKYAAVRAAEKAGFVVMANGSCVSDMAVAALFSIRSLVTDVRAAVDNVVAFQGGVR